VNGPAASDCTDPLRNQQNLTNQGTTGVSINNGTFIRSTSSSAKDIITINFIGYPSLDMGSASENTLPNGIQFSTTIAIR
jgi:hypothetical protein